MMKPETAYIYVIGAPGVQAVKVGYATDLSGRLSALQTGSPLPLSILWRKRVPAAPAVEAALHRRFSSKRVRGEWFDLGPDAARMVSEACEEIAADLPPDIVAAAADSPADGLPPLLPGQLVWRDAGRWYASLTDPPEYVRATDLAGHIRAFTDGQGAWLWSRLSEGRTLEIIREAYTDDITAPAGLEVQGDRIPVVLIGAVWNQLKRQAETDPWWAPHFGIPAAAAEAQAAALLAAHRAKLAAQ